LAEILRLVARDFADASIPALSDLKLPIVYIIYIDCIRGVVFGEHTMIGAVGVARIRKLVKGCSASIHLRRPACRKGWRNASPSTGSACRPHRNAAGNNQHHRKPARRSADQNPPRYQLAK
jgi:hypothetical protein